MTAATLDRRTDPATRPPDVRPALAGEPSGGLPPRRFPFRRILLATLLVALAGAVWWRFEGTSPEGPAEIFLQGNIDVRQVNLAFKVSGRIDSLAVDEGDAVKAGQVVATLDEVYFRDELRLVRAQRDNAEANLERLENGSRPEEIAQAKAAVAEREATRTRAQEELSRGRRLIGSRTIAREEFDRLFAAAEEARARLKSAREALRLSEIGPRQEDIAAARAQLREAEARVTESERRQTDSRLVAPNDGFMLTRAREKGAIVQPDETVFTLTLSSPVWVRTYVNEQDLGAVQPGMAVSVATDAAWGRSYTGHIGFVSPTAEFTPKTVETRELRTDLVYRLRVVVEDPDGGLRQGMPVNVTVPLPAPRPRTFKERLVEALGLDRLGFTPSRGR
jgi:HlyD family secretion protein